MPLVRAGRAYTCARRHSYDIARSGYVNLLQPQDRRSAAPGDERDVVAARGRLLDAGIGATLLDTVAALAATTSGSEESWVADLGSGSGHLLAVLSRHHHSAGIGIDISAAAADYAARRNPGLVWLVANADRRLPLANASCATIVSTHARRNVEECRRVIVPGGALVVAVPASDDLAELRAAVQATVDDRDRVAPLIDSHAGAFLTASRHTVREHHCLKGPLLRDLLRITYRGARAREAARMDDIREMTITLASEIVVFRRL